MVESVDELRRVGAGLRMVLMGLGVVVVNAITAVVFAFLFAEPGKEPTAIVEAMARDHTAAYTVLIGLEVLANVLAITGKVYCLSIPAAAGASQFILMAVACGGIGLALRVVGQVPEIDRSVLEFAQMGPVFTMVGFLFFLRFLRRLAVYLGSAPLLSKAIRVQSLTVALMVAVLVTLIGSGLGLATSATVIIMMGLLVAALFVFALYATLVRGLRRTVEAAAESAESDGAE